MDNANVVVEELTEVAGATQMQPVFSVLLAAGPAYLDRSVFQSGHTYLISMAARRSLPGAPNGVFGAPAFPVQTVTTWSPTFRVE